MQFDYAIKYSIHAGLILHVKGLIFYNNFLHDNHIET